MRDLRLIDNRLFIAGLGTSQAIVVSEDIKRWYLAHVEGFNSRFNIHIEVCEGSDFIACATGRSLIVINKDEFDGMFADQRLVMVSYLKRNLLSIRF